MKIKIKNNPISLIIHLLKPMPDFTNTFGKDIRFLVSRIKANKGNEFHLANDLGFVLVYYSVELCYQFQKEGNGSITTIVKNNIINQTITASEIYYRTDDHFKKSIKEKFNNVIKSPHIVQEAIEYLNRVRN